MNHALQRTKIEEERAALAALKSVYKERLANIELRIKEIDESHG